MGGGGNRSKACLEGAHHLHCITASLSVNKVVTTEVQTMVSYVLFKSYKLLKFIT